ncbi:MAG: 2-C-methyl-D-erythritol 2,4-cyclodiphosphate synthase [Candidatus Enteromonas sp.]|nr:2-C-methyl-D-erythritol 2,4-cyclodiphosphate synthase [Candidatus Enteromonas sp.]
MSDLRIGYGEDIHRLVPNRKLILGGVEIPFNQGLLGHSDADCLLHAIADALLGACALGDIGDHFPVDDPQWENADSKKILSESYSLVKKKGYQITNLDASVLAEKPRLSPYRLAMRESIARVLELDLNQVSVKLMTNEGLDAIGKGKAIRSTCICLLERKIL